MPGKSNSNCHEGTTRDSPSESTHVSIHTYCTLFLPNKYFTCFTILRIFVEIDLLQSYTGQGLLSGHWSLMVKWLGFNTLTAMAQLQPLASNQNPASNFCKPRHRGQPHQGGRQLSWCPNDKEAATTGRDEEWTFQERAAAVKCTRCSKELKRFKAKSKGQCVWSRVKQARLL